MRLKDIKRVGVVGAGRMGYGIALGFALWGYPTMLNDLNDLVLEKSLKNIKSALNLFVDEGLIARSQADDTIIRIVPTTDLARLAADSDFITEAIIERLEDKKILFHKLDGLCPPHTILASNTSSLMMSEFCAGVKRQDKIVITHYFEPAHIVPGVEVATGPGTSEETLKITYDLMEKTRKVPVRVLKEMPGCLLNRIQAAMRQEALRLWAEGVATAEDIELGITATFGFRMPHEGPLKHYDLAGHWQWPNDVRMAMVDRQVSGGDRLSAGTAEKIKRRLAQNNPWFIGPEALDDATEKRDREYLRRLKELYWSKET